MVIYLRHPKHGTKVAISVAEADADEKNGWVRYIAGAILTPAEPAERVESVIEESIEDVRKAYAEKFGARPHHLKKLDTLKRELEAA